MIMSEPTSKIEEQWQGVGVSDGVAVGRVLRLHNGAPSLYRTTIGDTEIEAEIARLNRALAAAHSQLAEIKERAGHELGIEHGYIFDAHLAILEDAKLRDEIEECIRRERVKAEWSVKVVTDKLLGAYAKIKDEYLRERGSDIEDVTRRVLKLLNGAPHVKGEMTDDAVVVAEELLPSTLAELDLARVRAVVSDVGGWTSHAAIIARGLGIPAVVGVRDLHRRFAQGMRFSLTPHTARSRFTLHRCG
jgi:phosphotransferase system enzyme I (PtsI)